jgi:hypothetical protein
MTLQEKKQLYREVMHDLAQVVKKHLFETNKEQYTTIDKSLNPMMNKIFNAINKYGIEYIERKRLELLRLNEDIDSVRNNVLNGTSPLGNIDWVEIANRTIDLSYGTANALINNTLYEKQVINRLNSEQFKFDKWQFCIVTTGDNIKFVDFVLPNDKRIKDILIEYMRKEGFYYNDAGLAFNEYLTYLHTREIMFNGDYYPTEEEIDVLSHWTFFRFFPISQKNVINTIKKNSQYLIHITPEENINNILKDGIQCQNKSHSTYPKRVFLIIPNRQDRKDWQQIKSEQPFKQYIIGLIRRLKEYRAEQGLKPTSYKALLIDIDKLPNNIGLYIDTPSYPYAVYTENTISPDFIERVETIDEIIKEFS